MGRGMSVTVLSSLDILCVLRREEAIDAGLVDANERQPMDDVSEGDRAARVQNAVACACSRNAARFTAHFLSRVCGSLRCSVTRRQLSAVSAQR
jgi:hypothetical protein